MLFMEEIINFVESQDFSEHPAITIYYYIYKSLVEPENEEYFKKLKTLIFEHIELFPHAEAKEIFDAATNYCVEKINKGDLKYNTEYYELSKIGLESGVSFDRGYHFPNEFSKYSHCFIARKRLLLDRKVYF